MAIKEDKKADFMKLFQEFYKRCLEEGFIPVAALGQNMTSMYAYFDFALVTKQEKEEITKALSKK